MSDIYRYETKFVLTEQTLSNFQGWLWAKTSFLTHYPSRINNTLYFDDIKFGSVRDNLAGISNRAKNRLRWYGSSLANKHLMHFETKIRNGRVGKKEINTFELIEKTDTDYTIKNLADQLNEYRFEKLKKTSNEYIVPTLFVKYYRHYWKSSNGIRLTIDRNIQFSYPYEQKMLSELNMQNIKKSVVEFKYDLEAKSEVTNLIRSLNLTPTRNSKYLTGLAMLKQVVYT